MSRFGDFKIRVTSPAMATTTTPSGYCYPRQHDQWFNIEVLQSPPGEETSGLQLHYSGPREMKDLTGAAISLHTALGGGLGIGAVTARNESGQLLYAGGLFSFESPLGMALPGLSWSPVELGCPFEPNLDGATVIQSKSVAVAVETAAGATFTLGSRQSASAIVDCAPSIVENLGSQINQVPPTSESLRSAVSFVIWRESLFK